VIVAIDGPAGSGKSTTARAVAKRLGFRHLDSGAFYRALVHAALETGIDPAQWDDLDGRTLDQLNVNCRPGAEGFRLYIGERDITDQLRSEEVNRRVSSIARVAAVRAWLLGRLRAAAAGVDLVADGRDIGTVVFPDAALKVFLVADAGERARRRLAERGVEQPEEPDLSAETERLLSRDRQDSERAVAPLRRSPDAVEIDTTGLSFKEQVDRIIELVQSVRGKAGGEGTGGFRG
jgi:cytidylate kinase